MEHIIGEYYECNGEIFRKLKLREGKCQIRTPEGKYMWVRPSDNTTFITKPTTPEPSDNITKLEAPSDKCDNTTSITEEHPDSKKHYIKHITIEEDYLLGAYGINK